MNNQLVINEILLKSQEALSSMKERTFTEFLLKDLDFENGINLRGIPLRGQAIAKVLNTIKVKKNFTDMVNKMSPEDWSQVSYKLKQAEGDIKMHGAITQEGENREITWAYNVNENKKRADDQVNYENYFNWLTESLGETEKIYSLNDFHYNTKDDVFNLTLLEQDSDMDVFGTGLDIWKTGQRFTFSGLYYNYAPFFERLICSNGNVARQYGKSSDISKHRYNNVKIEESIRKSIIQHNSEIPILLSNAVNHLKNNTISLAEFYSYKNFFDSRNENGKYDKILSQYFDEKPFYQAYGVNIKEKSRKWKSTANSGINGYTFFNTLTYLASHPDEVKMDHNDRLKLQIDASNLIFKKEMDLEDIATSVNVNYPKNPLIL